MLSYCLGRYQTEVLSLWSQVYSYDRSSTTEMVRCHEKLKQETDEMGNSLAEYTFTVLYRKGVANGNADGLSRA